MAVVVAHGYVLVVFLIIIILLSISIYQKMTTAVCKSRKNLEGRTVLVTGGTLGMGLVIATDLAHRGARVIIACPFKEEGTKAKAKIIQETENQNVVFKHLDLGSLESVRKFAADILESEKRLDILINNAAVGFPGDFITEDGMSFVMQVNYYGTFLLTLLLLPLLKKTGRPDEPSRIIVTASIAHFFGSIDIENYNRMNYWAKIKTYSNSKMCVVLFANELMTRLKDSDVVINSVDPGAVGTNLFSGLGKIVGTLAAAFCLVMFKDPWQGAQTALHAALDKQASKVNGQYFKNCELSNWSSKRANCEETRKKLWEHSIKLVGITDKELVNCFQTL